MLSLPRMALKLGLGRYDYALLSHDEPKFSHLLALAVLALHSADVGDDNA
jgi:hypothetical protein